MVKFHLDKKKEKESPIFLSLYHRGKRLKVYTGKKIEVLKWDVKSCRANPRRYKNNCVGFNEFLQGLSDEVEKLVNQNKPVSKADLKSIVDKANGKDTLKTFYGFATDMLERQIAKGQMSSASAKAYQVTINHLKKVSPALTFEDVDFQLYDKFMTHLREKPLSPNSIGGHIKRLKWFMAAAVERDLHSNLTFTKRAFKAPKEETDQIYLTRREITQLAKKPLPDRLKRVVDAFVLNCYLGMRFSDLVQIKKENFLKQDLMYYLQMVQDKTGERISIPIPKEALPLLRKYKFTCPVIGRSGKFISVQKFNEYLKEAAQLAELNAIEDIRMNGEVKKLPKHSLIKSHTARRSFATNLFLEGVPIQNIMAVTGHKKEETFLLYVRADQLTKANGLAKHYANRRQLTSKRKQTEPTV